jgi:fatty-acyl-CoA synthase
VGRHCLNYTSGTTGNPKGVVYHHRGAATNAISNVLEWDMPKHAVYLWTLPMFHCNGWCFPWTVAARAGVNVCLRRVEAQAIFDAIREHGVTHYCGAPIVHGLLVNAPAAMKAGHACGRQGHGGRRRAAGLDDRRHGRWAST